MIIKRYQDDELFRHIFWISIVYFLAHWFLLIATGRWWDDWVYADKNWDYLYDVARQASLPWTAYLDASTWLFPDGFYRVFVFFMFYVCVVFFYFILRKIDLFPATDCVWITLLFLTAPVNDARIMWICYPYSFGFMMFFIAFYISLLWRKQVGRKQQIIRVASLMLWITAYSFLESTMMLTALLLFYYYYEELRPGWVWRDGRKNIWKLCRAISHYLDYLFAPIIWYFGDKILFPGYGIYGGHSYIPWEKLAGIVLHSPRHAFLTLKAVLISYAQMLDWIVSRPWRWGIVHTWITLAFIGVVVCLAMKFMKTKESCEETSDFFKVIFMAFMGLVIFFAGSFPYFVKRDAALGNTYIAGRDSVLLGIGVAIFLYYGICFLMRENLSKLTVMFFIILGIIHFNFVYLDWQECYYQQLQLQCAMKQNDNIKNNDTFLTMFNGTKVSDSFSFYQFNGNSWTVFGHQNHLYMNIRDLRWFAKETELSLFLLNAYMMNEYEYGDRIIDGILFLEYKKMNRRTIVKQKWNELFRPDVFEGWIDAIKNVKYVPITPEESDALLGMYGRGELNNAAIYKMYF